MVIVCPKCKVKLKVADEKVAPEGTRFKCPRCSTVLLVKRPSHRQRPIDEHTVLVAHEDPSVRERIRSILSSGGYKVIAVGDGIEAMVSAIKELPFLAILSVSLPKIYGFEVSGKLKKRVETKDMKVILVASLYDKNRYRREPLQLYGADLYIEEHQIEESLTEKIDALKGVSPKGVEETLKKEEAAVQEAAQSEPKAGEPEAPRVTPSKPAAEGKVAGSSADPIEKAKRLARTIVSDIYLYSRAKVEEAIRNGTFHSTFASDMKEGIKLYDHRVPAEIRRQGDFFNEAVNNFIERKKRELS